MAETNISAANANPAATTETVLYTAPTGELGAAISKITVCETGGAAATFRIGISPGGGALAAGEYLAYDAAVDANEFLHIPGGFTLEADDEIRVYASTADLDFSAFGVELSA